MSSGGRGYTIDSTIIRKTSNYLGEKLKNVAKINIIETDDITQGKIGESSFQIKQFFDDSEINIKIRRGLSILQQKMVIPHELAHITLIDISRQAGSWIELAKLNQRLVQLYNKYSYEIDGKTYYDIDGAQHEWMAENNQWYERMLRDLYPGETEDFYKKGRWASLTDTDVFNNLPQGEQDEITEYLRKNGL